MPIQSTDPAPQQEPSGATADAGTVAGKALAGRLTRRGALALAPAVALAAGCSSKDKSKTTTGGTTTKTGAVDEVNYMTGFGSFGREAYAWVAEAKGYFRDNGLKVNINLGAGQPTELGGVLAGRTDFYCQEASLLLSLVAQPQYKGAKVIGAIHQHTVVALMALDKSGIKRPQDLQGKTIAYTGQAPHLLFPAYARLASIVNPGSAKWVFIQQAANLPAELMSGKVDAIGQFVTGAPLIQAGAAAAKQTVSILPYGDYLGDLPGNLLVTSANMIQNKPDVVHRFVDALMKGLEYAVNNPDECGQIMNQAVSTTKAPVATKELQVMKSYVVPTNGEPVGSLTPAGFTQTIALVTSIGLVQQGALTAEQVVDFNFVPKKA